jgi:predicted TIM-barrel fold metal-dependent hydrolase
MGILTLGMSAPSVERVTARAYNAWICDRVVATDERVKAMLYLPFNDHKASYDMVKEFGTKKGVAGFMMTTVRGTPIWANDYMKIFGLLQEMGLPLAFHAGWNWDEPMMRNTKQFVTVHAIDLTWHNAQYCTHWVINAMPEKFPKLKVIWIGGGISWATWLSQRLDNEYRMRSSECPGLKKLPSEYFTRRCITPRSRSRSRTTRC